MICFERSHFYLRKMPSYVDRPNWYSDCHLPLAYFFLSLSLFFFFLVWLTQKSNKVKPEYLVMHVTEQKSLSLKPYAVFYT